MPLWLEKSWKASSLMGSVITEVTIQVPIGGVDVLLGMKNWLCSGGGDNFCFAETGKIVLDNQKMFVVGCRSKKVDFDFFPWKIRVG